MSRKVIRVSSVNDYGDPKANKRLNFGSSEKKLNTVKASSLYESHMEPLWPSDNPTGPDRHAADIGPNLEEQPYVSKYATTFEPKSHYRYNPAYHSEVDEDGNPIGRPRTEPTKRRVTSAVADIVDGERKKQFIDWVMNGKSSDYGKAESLLFNKAKT